MDEMVLTYRLARFNARYARSLAEDRLEEWPGYFEDTCIYRVTTRENHTDGLAGSLIYASSKGMLEDRVQALREANIYERQGYRHLLGMPHIASDDGAAVKAETDFVVIRTMRTGQTDLFASGIYLDTVASTPTGELRLKERVVVCDSSRVDTLLAIPL